MPTKATKKTVPAKKQTASKSAGPYAKTDINNSAQVAAYMAQLDAPLKAEVDALRKIIHGVSKNITEQIKWNAPSFSYKGYLVTFSLRRPNEIILVFHNGILLH